MSAYEAHRRRHRKKKLLLAAALATTTATSCTDTPTQPPAAAFTPPRPSGEGAHPATAAPPTVVQLPRPARRPAHARKSDSNRPQPAVTAAAIGPDGWRRLGTLDVTAYCYTGSRTASGVWPEPGQVATLTAIPFGTRLRLAHLGTYTVTDRIGWGSDIDVYFPSCADARQFGRRHLTVWQEAA